MLKIIGIAIVVLIAAVLAFAATKPDSFRVQRTASIQAPPERILPLISDLHAWSAWNPFEKDPAMKKTYSGAASGRGAVYEWDGNSQVGAGRMEILDVTPEKVTIKLDFLRPFEGHNTAELTLAPRGNATDVTWAMYGPNRYLSKVMSVFMNMDTMIGKEFETGLANLKGIAEKA
ncbi:MAG: polyketide cyclase [Acidobacteria bacterium]|nr:MAG: polyketide cyclase [Acidobacteriota bacterium]